MKTRWDTDVKVGLFIILGAITLAIGVSIIGKFKWGKPEGYTVTATFESVSGIEQDSPVRMAGVRVGQVEKVFLKDGLANVVIRLVPEAVVREDSQIGVAAMGMLGEKYIEITSGSRNSPAVRPGGIVQGTEMVSLEKLIGQFSAIAVDVKAVSEALRKFFGDAEGKSQLNDLVARFDTMAQVITETVAENRAGLKGAVAGVDGVAHRAEKLIADNEQDVREVVRNLRETTGTLKAEVASLAEKVKKATDSVSTTVEGAGRDFHDGMGEIRQAAARIGETAESLRQVIEKARRGEGTIGKLLNDDTVLTNLNETFATLNSIAKKMEAGEGTLGKLITDDAAYTSLTSAFGSIEKFIKKSDDMKLKIGYRGEYLQETADIKSYFTLRVEPTDDKFYLIEAVDDPSGNYALTTTTIDETIDGETHQVVTRREEVDDSLKFTVLVGKRFSDIALKGGMIESTGGVAADWMPWNGKLRFSAEAFDFNRTDADMHLKLTGTWNVYRDLFVNLGVDDILEGDRRSFFAGAGLLFSDQDIKYLFGLSGLAN
jgi:phospholipid/cholesterol/gamma-HCH transport system substrate-binding protein